MNPRDVRLLVCYAASDANLTGVGVFSFVCAGVAAAEKAARKAEAAAVRVGGEAGAAMITDKYLVRGGSTSRPVLPITIAMAESDVVNPKARNEWENPQQRKLDKRMKRRAKFLNKLSVRHTVSDCDVCNDFD